MLKLSRTLKGLAISTNINKMDIKLTIILNNPNNEFVARYAKMFAPKDEFYNLLKEFSPEVIVFDLELGFKKFSINLIKKVGQISSFPSIEFIYIVDMQINDDLNTEKTTYFEVDKYLINQAWDKFNW